MKTVIASLIVLASSAAFACPNLSGNFDCQGQATMSIQQSGTNFLLTTTDSQGTYEQQIIADGQLREAGPSSDYKKATQVAKCDATNLNVVTEVLGNADELYQEILGASLQGQDLKIDLAMTLTQDGQVQEQKGVILCTRK